MQSEKSYKRIVIKIGSSVLTARDGAIDPQNIKRITDQVIVLVKQGYQLVLVSSGAVASGCSLLKIKTRPKDIVSLQAAASVGQSFLMQAYNDLFKHASLLSGQILLTWEDFNERKRYLNARHTILKLFETNVMPIVNENDVVAIDEIKFGDNDKLSALVANLIGADLLIILSDVDGLYKKERGKTKTIDIVGEVNEEIEKLACAEKGDLCVGGMSAKLEAIKIASSAGIPCVITNGKKDNTILKIIAGEKAGTLFMPKSSQLVARKRWIAFGAKPKGYVTVDDGAYTALVKRGKSLLSPGIIEVKGEFIKSDIVGILDTLGREFARGRIECDSEELKQLKGRHFHKEIIHRDNLAIIQK